jgi:hypothetical protein
MDDPEQLDEQLRLLEESCALFDAGVEAEAARIGGILMRIFHQTATNASLLTRLRATYARIASSVPRAPHPQDAFAPLTEVSIDYMAADEHIVSPTASALPTSALPRFRPFLDRLRVYRQVQAPDWWKNEPVFIMNHSKVTRREIAAWAVGEEGGMRFDERFSRLYQMLISRDMVSSTRSAFALDDIKMPSKIACLAALPQIAHEVLKSPELLKLAARSGKA